MSRRRNAQGFTLLEVLVALAIISIALVTMLTIVIQKQRDMHYLAARTIAHWVAETVVAEFKLGLLPGPRMSGAQMGRQAAWRRDWVWQALWTPTHNAEIWQVQVQVAKHESDPPLATVTGYQYAPEH